MKKLHFITLFIALIALGFTSCKDEDSEPSNAFTFDGETFSLQSGYIYDYGDGGGFIHLQSGTYSDETGYSANTTNYLGLQFYGSSADAFLEPGTYILGAEVGKEFSLSSIITNIAVSPDNAFNWSSSTSHELAPQTGGRVIISKSGTTYTIDIRIEYGEGKVMTGFFRGTLAPRILAV